LVPEAVCCPCSGRLRKAAASKTRAERFAVVVAVFAISFSLRIKIASPTLTFRTRRHICAQRACHYAIAKLNSLRHKDELNSS
jgi:hypothetical protein